MLFKLNALSGTSLIESDSREKIRLVHVHCVVMPHDLTPACWRACLLQGPDVLGTDQPMGLHSAWCAVNTPKESAVLPDQQIRDSCLAHLEIAKNATVGCLLSRGLQHQRGYTPPYTHTHTHSHTHTHTHTHTHSLSLSLSPTHRHRHRHRYRMSKIRDWVMDVAHSFWYGRDTAPRGVALYCDAINTPKSPAVTVETESLARPSADVVRCVCLSDIHE